MADMYTDIERSIWKTLENTLIALGLATPNADPTLPANSVYPLYNNILTKKDFPMASGALCIMKVSDVPNFENGGGTKAVLGTQTKNSAGVVTGIATQAWPQFYNLLYQIVALSDDLNIARTLDNLIRQALKPRTGMLLYDSTNNVWTTQRVDYHYAGYINRDVVADFKYWRVTNIRFEVPDYDATMVTNVGVINQINVSTEVAPLNTPADSNTDSTTFGS